MKKVIKKQESEWPRGMGRPAQNALEHAGIKTLKQVTKYSKSELLKLHGVGPKGLSVLETTLNEKGLAFKPEKK